MARLQRYLALPVLFLAVGCGSVPEVVVETARDSAKAAIEERVDEIVAELADELFGVVDLSSLLPSETSNE